MKIGRNDPCPCGSGKKYKQCCLNSKIIPFPSAPESETGNDSPNAYNPDTLAGMAGFDSAAELDDDLARYTEYCENLPEDSPIPSFMEFLGRANAATNMMSDLQTEAADLGITSEDELNDFLKEKNEAHNNKPITEFLGLSPIQMHSLLNGDIHNNNEIIKLNTGITNSDVKTTPIIKRVTAFFNEFIEAVGITGTLKLTAAGRLKPAFCLNYFERITGLDRSKTYIKKVDDYRALQLITILLTGCGYLSFGKTTCRVTEKGITQCREKNWSKIYLEFFDYYMESFEWDFLISYFDADSFLIYQDSILFSLYVLKKKANGSKTTNEIFKYFYDALLYNDFKDDETTMTILSSTYDTLVTEYLYSQFGLIDRDFSPERRTEDIYANPVKTSKLFNKLLKWNL